MELIEELDPEEARRIIDPVLQLMMEAVHRYEGYVVQSSGDGIFALFGAPIAHEDHPQRALYAALRMQEESRRYAERLRREHGVNLQIRVGVNTGEMVVRSIRKDDLHTDYTPIGHATGLAQRMESLAAPGAIFVTEATQQLTEGYFEFKPLGPARVKGVSEPVPIYEVTGIGPLRTRLQRAARRGLVRFVGRQSELEQMRQALERAKVGHGQIVAVVGEPGVGKSRLCYEFKMVARSGCLLLETFSVSHGKAAAYLPLIDLLKSYFAIESVDDERRRQEKITGKVLTLDRSLEDTLPYLFALLGIADSNNSLEQTDPQIRRRRTFEAIKRLLLRESLNQPLLILFEDLHWLDSETQAFLNVLSESVATAPILLLVNYRPEYQHGWGGKSYYTQLRLDPLGGEDAQALLAALLGEAAGLEPLKRRLLEQTGGNPFFLEEMVQALFDEGVLVRNGAVSLTRPVTAIQIPATVQGVLAARIDRLGAAEKALLQSLAVVGKEFSAGLIRQVVEQPEEELHRQLSRLQATEFIYEQPAFPEIEYTFKHALTQEVAYNTVLKERRSVLHERAAQAIEALYAGGLEEHYSELAHHYSRTTNTAKAVDYLERAGQQALERSAPAEAIRHFREAIERLQTLPDTPERAREELRLQIALSVPLRSTGPAVPGAERLFTRAQELCRQVGDTPQLVQVLHGLALLHIGKGELQRAREVAEECLERAQSVRDSRLLAAAHARLGQVLLFRGELAPARAHLEQVGALLAAEPRHSLVAVAADGRVAGLSHGSGALCLLGYPDQALERSHEALTLAQELSHPYSIVYARNHAGRLHLFRRESHAAQEQAEAMIVLADEHGFDWWSVVATIMRGSALAGQGQVEEGIAQMLQGIEAHPTSGSTAARRRPYHLALLAAGYGRAGQADQGLATAVEALATAARTGERDYEAELYRLQGELRLMQAAGRRGSRTVPAEAERAFLQAIEVARRQEAKSLELRAAVSLSRLWQRQGKHNEARELLALVYGWFTEGFDTADLQEAKALLEEL
jgi:class 3 adenylate cyclase/predicted ATPase